MKMKKIRSIIALLLSCLSLAACSGQKDGDESTWKGIQASRDNLSSDRTEYYDIVAEQELIFQWEPDKEGSPLSTENITKLIGMQFYQGEPVQLWSVPQGFLYDIYLYRQDGSREVLLQGIPYPSYGYMDQDGNIYLCKNSTTRKWSDGRIEKINTFLKKYDSMGELLFEKEFDYDYNIQEIRQTADGRVYLFITGKREIEGQETQLAELDPATGNVTELSAASPSKAVIEPHFGIWGEKLVTFKLQVILGYDEVTAINVDDGSESCILSFQGTSYVSPKGFRLLQDFRILEDESVEILWSDYDGSKSLRERLRMDKVEKTPIVLRGGNIRSSWFADRVNDFNQQSETYHVVVENCGQGDDVADFARLTSVQIASGKGPDIVEGGLMKDYMSGMMEKGALEDLRPYMEKSGLREEDYFPFTFDVWRDGDRICGVSPASPSLESYSLDSAVLGGIQEPDIETLVDSLLSRQENAIFLKDYDSQKLLELLLKGSDTLWGMVDWKKGSCDFSGELFAKILETAKRYGDSNDKGTVTPIAEKRHIRDIYLFEDRAERDRDGKTICGVLFDDGCHVAVTSNFILGINANSPNKEGAWEFISYLLGDEAQSATLGSATHTLGIPAARKAFDTWVERQKEQLSDGKEIRVVYADFLPDGSTEVLSDIIVYTEADVTEEIIAEYTEELENARSYPLRTAPILDIISEEAADYFNGSKSAEMVGNVVANRVQTYLDEGR